MKISYKEYNIKINLKLLEKNNKLHNLEQLKQVYIELFKIFEKMEDSNDRIELYEYSKKIEEIEFKMQELWGFEKNKYYHRYWCNNPKCICPKLDNYEYFGISMRCYNDECLIHGVKTRQKILRKDKLKRIINDMER